MDLTSMENLIAAFDMTCFSFFGNIQSDFLTRMALMLSLDSVFLLIAGGLILAAICVIRRTRKMGVTIVLSLGISMMINNLILKQLIHRARPYIALQDNPDFQKWFIAAGMHMDPSFSFPSGHAVAVTAVCIVLMLYHMKSERKPAKAVAWIFPLFAFLSGCSRVYFMIHYATDVMGGFLIGAAGGIAAYYLICYIAARFSARES